MKAKVVVVYCHPNPKSYTHAVCDAVMSGLADAECDIELVDLYQENFDPVLVVNEEHRRRDLDKVAYTEKYRDQLKNCSAIVFVYPVWWGGFPAVLKGYIDRVFVSGLTYSFQGKPKNAVLPFGLMKDKEAHFFYTLDSPALVSLLDPGWFSNYFTVFNYCGFKKVHRHYLSRLKLTTQEQRTQWLLDVKNKAYDLGKRLTA